MSRLPPELMHATLPHASMISRHRLVVALAAVLVATGVHGEPPGDPLNPDPRRSERVSVQAAASRDPVIAGEPFSVHVVVAPLPELKVYAPGSQGYTPVTLELDWPGDVRPLKPRYPPSEPFIFGALKELVHVYTGPFRITQRVTIPSTARSAKEGSLMVTGLLRFQSCNDRLCFPPESRRLEIPLRIEKPKDRRGKGAASD